MSLSEDKVRFVLIGCGKISRNHIAGVRRISDVAELVGVCDPNEERARAAADAAGGVPHFTSIETMLEQTKAHCGIVGTPSGMHPEHAALVAQAGLHVITEKPMAVSTAAADAMLKAVRDAGTQLFVIKQNRLLPSVQALHGALRRDAFGRLLMGQVNVFWTRPQAYYDEAPWRGTWAMDGGAFLNQASHYIDLLQWFFGPVQSVQAHVATMGRDIEAEDSGIALVRFTSGAVASINVTMLTYPKNLEGSITVLGERGTAKLTGRGLAEIAAWDLEDEPALGELPSMPSGPGAGHEPYFRNVVDVIQGRADPSTSGEEARKSLELIEAIYLSSREGRVVTLPLQSADS